MPAKKTSSNLKCYGFLLCFVTTLAYAENPTKMTGEARRAGPSWLFFPTEVDKFTHGTYRLIDFPKKSTPVAGDFAFITVEGKTIPCTIPFTGGCFEAVTYKIISYDPLQNRGPVRDFASEIDDKRRYRNDSMAMPKFRR